MSAKVSPSLDNMDQLANAYAGHNALLDVQIGRAIYQEALNRALLLFDADPVMVGPHVVPDMIEASVRVGDRTAAEKAMARLSNRATAAGTPWALGLLARSQALMAGAGAEEHYTLAIELLSATPLDLQRGRAHLLYGEWLRRERRHTTRATTCARLTKCWPSWVPMASPNGPGSSCSPAGNVLEKDRWRTVTT